MTLDDTLAPWSEHELEELIGDLDERLELGITVEGDERRKEAAHWLAELGYGEVPTTAEPGRSELESALRLFQDEADLPVTGELDDGTWDRLETDCAADPPRELSQPLKRGERGVIVRTLQLSLRRLGLLRRTVRGEFDDATAGAVRAARTLLEIPEPAAAKLEDVDPAMWRKLHDPYFLARVFRERHGSEAFIVRPGPGTTGPSLHSVAGLRLSNGTFVALQQSEPDSNAAGSNGWWPRDPLGAGDDLADESADGLETGHHQELATVESQEVPWVMHALQRRLQMTGYEPGRLDGRVGPKTIEALLAFLRDTAGEEPRLGSDGPALDRVFLRIDEVRFLLAPGVFDWLGYEAPTTAELDRYQETLLREAEVELKQSDDEKRPGGFFRRAWNAVTGAAGRAWHAGKEMVKRVGQAIGRGLGWAWQRLVSAGQLALTAARLLKRRLAQALRQIRKGLATLAAMWSDRPIVTTKQDGQVATSLSIDADMVNLVVGDDPGPAVRAHALKLREMARDLTKSAALVGRVLGVVIALQTGLGAFRLALKLARAAHRALSSAPLPAASIV